MSYSYPHEATAEILHRTFFAKMQPYYNRLKTIDLVSEPDFDVLGYFLLFSVSSLEFSSVLRARICDLRFCKLDRKLFFKRFSRSFAFLLLFVISFNYQF